MAIILLLYHPFKRKPPLEKTRAEQAELLVEMAKQAHILSTHTKPQVPMGTLVLLYIGVTAIVLVFGVHLNNAALFQSLLTNKYSADYGLNMILFGMLCCCIFVPLDYLRALTTGLFIRYPIPYSFVVEVEAYHVLTDKNLSEAQAAQLREEALALERIQAYPRAKALLLKAAHLGDVSAMEHYARHCLIAHQHLPARYWLEKCIASAGASPEAQKMWKQIKRHRRIDVRFLKEDDSYSADTKNRK